MRLSNKRLLLGVIFSLLLAALFNINAFSYVVFNYSGNAYGGGENTDGISSVSSFDSYMIETYVIEGAGYYLEATTEFRKLLGIVELQDFKGVDMANYGDTLRNAIVSMENAKATYDLLIQAAETTPYNPEVQEKLAAFDYTAFGEEKGLNSVMLEKVERFLKSGDITGVFEDASAIFVSIIDQLYFIETEFNEDRVAETEIFWKVNEAFSNTNLFGSYVARVFSEIKN